MPKKSHIAARSSPHIETGPAGFVHPQAQTHDSAGESRAARTFHCVGSSCLTGASAAPSLRQTCQFSFCQGGAASVYRMAIAVSGKANINPQYEAHCRMLSEIVGLNTSAPDMRNLSKSRKRFSQTCNQRARLHSTGQPELDYRGGGGSLKCLTIYWTPRRQFVVL